ncbi:MAG: hypothetical protein MI975_24590 [Cytophagales bacterium]|nr:hypothetical protein [Cytophagales bacterium]
MDHSDIKNCLAEIEQKLDWGSPESWKNQDFELLSEEIFTKTGTNLSVTTLKRIWGKVDYQSRPSASTLNVLARFLDYKHWRDFQNSYERTSEKTNLWSIKGLFHQKMLVVIVVLIAFLSLFFLIDRRQVFFKSDEVVFNSRKVSDGLPNTVIFDYDVSKVIADSFFIQQSWDRRRRVRISPKETQHTSFYYYPGYFHAKLAANDQVIKEHEVLVESNGWTGMIERFPEPIYIENMMTTSGGILTADFSNYSNKEKHFQDKDFWVDYYLVKKMDEIDANNFEYECRIKNDSELGSVCRESRISLICTQGRFNIPLCQPGCVSNINLTLGNTYLSGKSHDLSALGCEIKEWIDFKLKVEDKTCTIFINDQLKITQNYTMDLGKIVGFKFKFNGAGKVDFLKLKNHPFSPSHGRNSTVYEEDFEDNS